ncbi:MAG: hypothetical protein E6J87_22835 [Deltaproteobacteria bacterium]|nr:MAG: hypothetical protein E6J87_22835 [Deltaproteobacteria bacterium]
MPVFLLFSTGSPHDNSTGRNAVIASGNTEADARAAAAAVAPDGETKVHAGWSAFTLASLPHADLTAAGGVVWLQGHGVAEPLRRSRGN